MATREEIYTAIRNADQAGDSAAVRKLGAYLATLPPEGSAPKPLNASATHEMAAAVQPSFTDKVKQQAGNVVAGAVRGAGSIGATLLTPVDAAARALGVQNDFIGRTDRREAMDAGLQSLGADPNSIAFRTGKLGAEIAGTAGAGGALARGVAAIPGVAAAAPGVVSAIRTAGLSAGGATGAAGLAARAAGGAVTGAASAGLVDPQYAASGAVIGGALPGVAQAAGKVGQKIGSALRGPAQTAEQTAAITAARNLGYVIPPTQANPSLVNRVLEGVSGKITTAQNASLKNQLVTNRLAAQTVGLPADTKLTPDVLKSVRDQAGAAYDAVGQAGTVTPGKDYTDALDKIAAPYLKAAAGFPDAKPSPVIDLVNSLKSPSFDAGSAVAKIKELRSAADDAFRTGNTDVARASKSAAGALENALEDHLAQAGDPAALRNFKDARQLIAKTYSVEKALNGTTGNVDARKLADQLRKNKPLSGGIRDAAEFAARFPKAAQMTEAIGSTPQTSPLDWAAGGSVAMALHNPAYLAGVAARPAARALTLSNMVQNRLAATPPSQRMTLLKDLAAQGVFRGAPLITSAQ